MHLLYLGIMKKLLHYWKDGNVKELKLTDCDKIQLSNLLQKIKVPAEFQRTTRSLPECSLIASVTRDSTIRRAPAKN